MTTLPVHGSLNWDLSLNAALAEIDQGDPFRAADHGFISWSIDPSQAANSTSLTADITMMRVNVRQPRLISNVAAFVVTAGTGLTAGACWAGLYNSAGALAGQTADQATVWQTEGAKVMPLAAAVNATPGAYYVAFLATGTTLPTLAREGQQTGGTDTLINIGLSAATARTATAARTGDTLPASIDMTTRTMSKESFFVAVS